MRIVEARAAIAAVFNARRWIRTTVYIGLSPTAEPLCYARMAPAAGLEPATTRVTVEVATCREERE
jgi:hypothetical protein